MSDEREEEVTDKPMMAMEIEIDVNVNVVADKTTLDKYVSERSSL